MLTTTRFTALSLLLASSCSWANGFFYIGAGAGPAAANFKQHSHVVVQPAGSPVIANVYNDTQLAGTGAVGSLFGGYLWQKKQYALACEINADVSSMKFEFNNLETISGTNTSATYRLQNAAGVNLLPGYIYRDTTLFYGRIGYASGNFKISTTETTLANINQRLNGIRYGLGVSQLFTNHIAARMEYTYTSYASKTLNVTSGATTKSTSITPAVGEAVFSLIYIC